MIFNAFIAWKLLKDGLIESNNILLGHKNVVCCPKCLEDVRNQIQEFVSKKRKQQVIIHMENVNDFEDVKVLGGSQWGRGKLNVCYHQKKESITRTRCSVSKKFKVLQSSNNWGPLNSYFSPKTTVLEKNLKQTTIDKNNPAKKELREQACVALARWLYDAGIYLSML